MIMKITDKAAKSLENTTYTKEEALVLEREIEEALNSTQSKQGTTWFNVGSASVWERSQSSFPNPQTREKSSHLVKCHVQLREFNMSQLSKMLPFSFCCRQKLLLFYAYIYSLCLYTRSINLSALYSITVHLYVIRNVHNFRDL